MKVSSKNLAPSGALSLFSKEGLYLAKYIADIAIIFTCYLASYLIRFEGEIPARIQYVMFSAMPVFLFGFLLCDYILGLTRGIWRYISIKDMQKIAVLIFSGNGVAMVTGTIFANEVLAAVPRSIYVINSLLLFFSIGGSRFLYRMVFEWMRRAAKKTENVLIIGSGDMAATMLRLLSVERTRKFNVAGFITADIDMVGKTIDSVPILGTAEKLPDIVKRYDVKYIFMAASAEDDRNLKDTLKAAYGTNATVRIVPSVRELVGKKFALNDLKDIKYEDYLERSVVEFDTAALREDLCGKSIMVTGGGGSIGLSICKELLRYGPARIIVLDISENNLFRASYDIKEACDKLGIKETEIVCRIADVRDMSILKEVFGRYPVDYVIHAAALKHVPLAESNVTEAVTTNVGGAVNLMDCAQAYNVLKFVYISTDKAVEPVSVMGMTKRVGEILVKSRSSDPSVRTRYIAVRFGNVIGSCGNVIEIFTHQLKEGRKITITDPHMERYFMCLDEATKLILEAIRIGRGGDILVLDMGSPVKIKDLAYGMALFYGRHLTDDDIVYTGGREGEKTSEKLFSRTELPAPTSFTKIFKAREDTDAAGIDGDARRLCDTAGRREEDKTKDMLRSIIEKYGKRQGG